MTAAEPNTHKSSSRMRFRLGTVLMLVLIVALVAGWARDRVLLNQAREVGKIRIEIYTDPKAFAQRVGRNVRVINFDEIHTEENDAPLFGRQSYMSNGTASRDVSEFKSDRYESEGIRIVGIGGQYVGRSFGQPNDFEAASWPNAYAPGPVGKNPGGFTTDVTFLNGKSRGLVMGFGLNFIDVDFTMIKASGLEIFDRFGTLLASYNAINGPNRTPVFRGVVAVDESGSPVPVIARVKLTNGTGWPGVDAGETVTMDDFIYNVPAAFPK